MAERFLISFGSLIDGKEIYGGPPDSQAKVLLMAQVRSIQFLKDKNVVS
jgi:hypothetical protein